MVSCALSVGAQYHSAESKFMRIDARTNTSRTSPWHAESRRKRTRRAPQGLPALVNSKLAVTTKHRRRQPRSQTASQSSSRYDRSPSLSHGGWVFRGAQHAKHYHPLLFEEHHQRFPAYRAAFVDERVAHCGRGLPLSRAAATASVALVVHAATASNSSISSL